MATCRLCKKYDDESRMLKYSTRHYAHPDCYFAAGKSIDRLHEWQIRNIPYLVLKNRGLLEHPRVIALTAKINAEIAWHDAFMAKART